MLGNKKAVANVAVKDLEVATKFYKETLGLTPVHEEARELVVFRSGASEINVYRSMSRRQRHLLLRHVDDHIRALYVVRNPDKLRGFLEHTQ